jgi:hypothetical protein
MRAAGSGDAAILRDADLVVSGLNRLPPVVSVPTVPAA